MSTETEIPAAGGTFPFTAGYSQVKKPLGGYAVLTAGFAVVFGGAYVSLKRGKRLPKKIGAGDLVLIGVGTHKLSRLLAKDRVTSFIRAPFTEYEGEGGPGEVEEKARGSGLRLAIGELLICPYCLSQWVAAAFIIGLAMAPRFTRLIAAMLTAVTISDVLQIGYKAAEEKSL